MNINLLVRLTRWVVAATKCHLVLIRLTLTKILLISSRILWIFNCLQRISSQTYHCTKDEVLNYNFFSKCDQIHRKLKIWSHLLKKFLMENFIFCAVYLKHHLHFYFYQPILVSVFPVLSSFGCEICVKFELILKFPTTNLWLFLNFRFSKTNLGSVEFLSYSLTLWKFKFENTKPRLLISLTI